MDINRLLSVASVIDLGKRDIQQQVAFGRERGWTVRYIHNKLVSAEDCVWLVLIRAESCFRRGIDRLNYRQSSSRFFRTRGMIVNVITKGQLHKIDNDG